MVRDPPECRLDHRVSSAAHSQFLPFRLREQEAANRQGNKGHEESISNRRLCGLLMNLHLLFVLHFRIPANEGLPEFAIEDLCPHVEEVVRAGLTPSHLLLLDHALAHHLIHRGLREARGNLLSVPATIPIIWDEVLVRFDIAAKFSHDLQELLSALAVLW